MELAFKLFYCIKHINEHVITQSHIHTHAHVYTVTPLIIHLCTNTIHTRIAHQGRVDNHTYTTPSTSQMHIGTHVCTHTQSSKRKPRSCTHIHTHTHSQPYLCVHRHVMGQPQAVHKRHVVLQLLPA